MPIRAITLIASMLVVSCAAVLGIEEAERRPPIDGPGGAGGAPAGGMGGAPMPWLASAHSHRQRLTLDTAVTTTDLGPTTVAVTILEGDFSDAGFPDGRDVVFTSADGLERLPHELVVFDQDEGAMTAWVRLPAVQALTTTDLFMYFGDPTADDQQDVAATWPSDPYRGVWHLDDNPSGPGLPIRDSSTHGNHGAILGDPALVPGVAAGALDFDGDLDRVVVDDLVGALDFGNSSFTFSLWAFVTEYTNAGDVLLFKGSGTIGWQVDLNPMASWQVLLFDSGAVDSAAFDTTLGVWAHIVGVVDRNDDNLHVFLNGTFMGQQNGFTTGSLDTDEPLFLSPGGNPCIAVMDEVRVYGRVLRPDEVLLEHHNLDPNATFTLAGPAETRP